MPHFRKTVTFICLAAFLLSCEKEPDPPGLATISTTAPSGVTITSAISGGTVISNGGDSVIERGICYSTDPNPTIQNQKISSGSGNGNFTCSITNISPASTVYIRAYATNIAGTAYGNQVTLLTNTTGILIKIVDSASALVYDTLEYDANQKLVKFYATKGGGSPNNGYADTFMYSNNNLVKSLYSLGATINLASPYAKTDYVYQNNILSSSKYYLGNSNLITSSVYSFDSQGRLNQVTQTQINGTVGSYPTYTTRFEYDANANLSKVYYRQNPYPEYLHIEYLDYDNKDNPFYKLPWTFDYNIFQENADKLSKNNVGRINTYSSFQGSMPFLNGTQQYEYKYNVDNKVAQRKILSGGSSTGTKYFIYRYQ